MDEKSWRKNNGRQIIEEHSWNSNHAGAIAAGAGGREIMDEPSWRSNPARSNHARAIMEQQSWKGNHGGAIVEEKSWR